MISPELNIEEAESLCRYLRENGHISDSEHVTCRPLPGGVSSRTVLVERSAGRDMVVKQALAKLRVQAEWFSDPVRVHREAAGIRWLSAILADASFAAVPELLFEDEQFHVIGMTAVPQPHENLKTLFLAGVIDSDVVQCCALLLARIHTKSEGIGGPFKTEFVDRTFFHGLRLEPYYEFTAGKVPQAAESLRRLVADTLGVQVCLVHGDFSPKNILIHDGRPFLLDHEVIHRGDPAFDLGFMITHLLSKARHLPDHRERFAEAANRFWAAYAGHVRDTEWWPGLEERVVRHTLACMLARVRGRSPLDYLAEAEKDAQAAAVLRIMERLPSSQTALIEQAVTEGLADADH